MPLTPRFSLSQTDDAVTLRIHVPFVRKVSGMELVILNQSHVYL